MAYNLGNFSNQLSLNERNNAANAVGGASQNAGVRQAAASSQMADNMSGNGYADPTTTRTLGSIGQNAVDKNPYGESQAKRANAWDTTQKYMGALSTAGDDSKNGLQKVLGIVGMFA